MQYLFLEQLKLIHNIFLGFFHYFQTRKKYS